MSNEAAFEIDDSVREFLNFRERQVGNSDRTLPSQMAFASVTLAWISLLLASAAAWVTHVIVCIKASAWVLLAFGCIVAPVGVIHGAGVWLGIF